MLTTTKLMAATVTTAALLAACGASDGAGTVAAPAGTSSAVTSASAAQTASLTSTTSTSPTNSTTSAAPAPTAGPASPTAGPTAGPTVTAAPGAGAPAPTTGAAPTSAAAQRTGKAPAGTSRAAGAATTPGSVGALAGSIAAASGGTAGTAGSAVRLPTGYRIPAAFFGVHDGTPIGSRDGWPATSVGSLRAWDAGVTWRQIEVAPGRYDFRRLDAIVRQANLKGAETLIVLGQTPTFYASRRFASDVYGSGAASMPNNLNAWKRYVAAVANRPGIKGNRRVSFQVWNEANVREFWTGSPGQMATLTKLTRDALGGSRYLVAPALVTRNAAQRRWTDAFYASKVSGRRVADYVNAVSLQLYPLPAGTPEDSMAILALDKKILAKYRVRKPIWNTEVNYGLAGRPTRPIADSRQAANVARTYLLNAANGVSRVYWYMWNPTNLANTNMTKSNGSSLTMAGKAYGVTRSWLLNSQMRACTVDRAGTYTCTINYTQGVRRVFWNPKKVATVTVPGATSTQAVDGRTSSFRARTLRLKVGPIPVMVRSAR